MRKKNVLVIILTLLLFLSAAVLGVSTVYRVSDVTVYAPVVSEEAKEEAKQLKERLLAAYEKDSTLFADSEKAEAIVAEFPYFRLRSFERSYPDRIVIEVQEDAEVYAVSVGEGSSSYYILNAEGTVLGVRESYANRSDGVDNVLIDGLHVFGEKGKTLSGDDCLDCLFTVLQQMHARLEGIRRNVRSVEVQRPASDRKQTMFVFAMAEGVRLYIRDPYEDTTTKVNAALDAYTTLADSQRLTGVVLVYDGENGVKTQYFNQTDGIL